MRGREREQNALLSCKGLVKRISFTLGTKEQILVDNSAGAAAAEIDCAGTRSHSTRTERRKPMAV